MNKNKRQWLSFILVLSILLSNFSGLVYATESSFADARGHWAEDVINRLTEKGIVHGYPDGLCHPDSMITRAEFSALVARVTKLQPKDKEVDFTGFEDIQGNFAQEDIERLVDAGIILQEEYGQYYYPNTPITRIEIIRMMVRSINEHSHDENFTEDANFTDIADVSKEDLEYIYHGKQHGIISGYPDGTVRPEGKATRAEAFSMLDRLFKIKNEMEQTQEEVTDEVELIDETKEHEQTSGHRPSRVPAPQYHFEVPKTAYVDEEISIVPESRYVKSVKWTVSKNNIPIGLNTAIEGELTADGGLVKIKSMGSYTLMATAMNSRGRTVTHEQTITVYPNITTELDLLEKAHTDTSVIVDLITENLGEKDLEWSIKQDDKVIEMDSAFTGELSNEGGTVQFKSQGTYELIATIEDDLGKVITASDTINIYPVAKINLEMESITHSDRPITIKTETENIGDMELQWTLARNGEDIPIVDFIEGEITAGKQRIRFKEKGVYNLTASATDETGRVFTDSTSVMVYPVGSAGFYLPELFHTDDTVTVEATFNEIGEHRADWTLLKDGEPVEISKVTTGQLTNQGGELRFKHKGQYILRASFTDDGGRSYSYEQTFKVYPVPTITYSLPEYAHTDTDIKVDANSTEINDLTVEWLLDNTFGFQDWSTYVDGTLNNDGGTIQFKRAGIYELVARIIDETGRVFLFEPGDRTEVLPVLNIDFELPKLAYTDSTMDIRTHGNNSVLPVEWKITKDGEEISMNKAILGELNAYGGKITFLNAGDYVLTATITDFLGRSFSHSQEISIHPVIQYTFTMPESIHFGKTFEVETRSLNLDENQVKWTLEKTEESVEFEGELTNDGGEIAIRDTGEFVLTATIIDPYGRMYQSSEGIEVTNTAPEVTLSAVPTRTAKEGKFFVNIEAKATDADGDATTLEYEGRMADDYYEVDTHTIRVRARDEAGFYSPWLEKSFTVVNASPTVTLKVTQSRTTKDGKFLVEVEASATDDDGDQTTLEYDGRTPDDYYEVGNHVIRVRAKDEAGFYSPWLEQSFTVVNAAPTFTLTATQTRTTKDGKFLVEVEASATDADGDATTLEYEGRTEDDYYEVGDHIIRVRVKDEAGFYSPWLEKSFTVVNAAPTVTLTATQTRTIKNGKFLVNIQAEATDADGDTTTLEYEGRTPGDYYEVGDHIIRVRAKDEAGFYSPWLEKNFTVVNAAPIVTLTATPTRTIKNGKFLVNVQAGATDADGDQTTLEYEGRTPDDYYAVGTHTIRVRAKDEAGAYSPWLAKNFTVTNSAPTAPVISRSPSGNSVSPGTPVTITALSTDPDGDSISYIWDGRSSETQTYPRGKNVVRVKAVDAAGAESPWAAIVFFVADANGGGGMTLTGPDSVILEEGLEGATITEYTFTVPPVSGHSGSDFGRVRGYNVKTKQWDQLDYETTKNGITFSRTLSSGVYSQLEFYYYTNHNCMYNKSNITYSVKYHFE
ncbi:S-layer homology domain-containing protein [Fusibacter sp. JL216-2]|uniref:S-layer homology domain-containing protein n=1 Tax=Fusibacter sp. JL216-2 TaxID=3071453 RepID=UPI003D33260A